MTNITIPPMRSFLIVEQPAEKESQPKIKKLSKAEKKRLAALEFKKLELRDSLRRELALSKKTVCKHRETWESMCKKIKLKQMKDELEYWELKHNRMLAQKDETINTVFEEFERTEETQLISLSKHLELIDYLRYCYETIQDASQNLYDSVAFEMVDGFYKEYDTLSHNIANFKTTTECIMDCNNKRLEHELQTNFAEALDKRDDLVNNEIMERYRMRDTIVLKINKLQNQLFDFVNSLMNSSLDANRQQRLQLLKNRQAEFEKESKKLTEIESKTSDILAKVQNDMITEEIDSKKRINNLKMQYTYFLEFRRNLEHHIQADREITYEKQKIVAVESYYIAEKCKRLKKYGELLLSLAANCRKLQTEGEKVVAPSETDSSSNPPDIKETDKFFTIQVLDLKAHVDMSEEDLQAMMKLMQKFWKRQAIAEAQNTALKEKKAVLLKENQKYIEIIKSMSKTTDVTKLQETLIVNDAKL